MLQKVRISPVNGKTHKVLLDFTVFFFKLEIIICPKLEEQKQHILCQEAVWLFSFLQLTVAGTNLEG